MRRKPHVKKQQRAACVRVALFGKIALLQNGGVLGGEAPPTRRKADRREASRLVYIYIYIHMYVIAQESAQEKP